MFMHRISLLIDIPPDCWDLSLFILSTYRLYSIFTCILVKNEVRLYICVCVGVCVLFCREWHFASFIPTLTWGWVELGPYRRIFLLILHLDDVRNWFHFSTNNELFALEVMKALIVCFEWQRDARREGKDGWPPSTNTTYDAPTITMPLIEFIHHPVAHELVHNGATFQVSVCSTWTWITHHTLERLLV